MNNVNIFVVITIIVSVIMCSMCHDPTYATMTLLPLSFLIVYALLKNAFNSGYKVSIYIIGGLLWFRMVALPLMGVTDISYQLNCVQNTNLFYKAIFLCIYEGLLLSFVVNIMAKHVLSNNLKAKYVLELHGNKNLYLLYILFAALVFFTMGRHMHLFEFAIKSIGGGERTEEELDANALLIRQIVSTGLVVLFCYIVDRLRQKYNYTWNYKYVRIAIACAVLMVCIIVGERRTSQIYVAFASCWLLCHVFPSAQKRINRAIIGAAVFVLIMMTVYKHFNAFLYDSYSEAIENASFNEVFSPGMFDAYFYGINTIVKNINFGEISQLGIFHSLYDLARCTFGLNFCVPRNIGLTSELYNLYLYGGEQSHGYLLSSIGYGYIYLGIVLAPLFSCINIICLMFFERKMKTATSVEMTYIWAFVFMRFGFGVLGSLPPLVSLITRYLFFSGSIYLLAKKINNR